MPNIPYPEFNDFRLTLNKKEVDGDDPIEGIARLSMNSAPNCVKGEVLVLPVFLVLPFIVVCSCLFLLVLACPCLSLLVLACPCL
eukprot:Pgem_evm1s4663